MFHYNYEQDIINELPKCLRILPHDNGTSGFFITVFRKVGEIQPEAKTKVQPKVDLSAKKEEIAKKFPVPKVI